MKRRTKRRMRSIFIGGMVMCLAVAASGCGKKELPPDTPWNNGYNAVMETENGYYMDNYFRHFLQFHDKETGKVIPLCGKPECQHIGEESCVASFRNMPIVNSVLYDGAIYVLSREYENDTASINLYRASPDGSTISKVGEVFSSKNTTDRTCEYKDVLTCSFILHKGYAYVPFYISFSHGEKGFVNGGLMRMNIQTGATEQIYKMEFFTSAMPRNLRGVGDYVYFDVARDRKKTNNGTFRYHIKDGTIENAFGEARAKNELHAAAVTEKKIYVLTRSSRGKLGLGAFDSDSREYLGTLFYPDLDDECPGEKQGILWTEIAEGQDEVGCGSWGVAEPLYARVIAYQDKFFFLGREKVTLYNDKGEKLGQTGYDFPVPKIEENGYGNPNYLYPNGKLRFKICQDKLYAICCSYRSSNMGRYYFEFYSVPIEDLMNGKDEWTFDYASFYEYRDVELNHFDMSYEEFGDRGYSDWSVYAMGEGRFWDDEVK